MKYFKWFLLPSLMVFSIVAHCASVTCYKIDIKEENGKKSEAGYPTKIIEESNQVKVNLAGNEIQLPPFHEVSESVYGTRISQYVFVKKFVDGGVVYIMKIKSTGETIFISQCS